MRKAHNQLEKDNTSFRYTIKTLQQKHDELQRSHEQATLKLHELQELRSVPCKTEQSTISGGCAYVYVNACEHVHVCMYVSVCM